MTTDRNNDSRKDREMIDTNREVARWDQDWEGTPNAILI
jgi:hypothetical protein